ncbi:hypothetical protein ACOBQB_10610 [Streptomyces sp. G5(2025)]|uniref:hypothetical protein n=1 Tax=Streptomyces sp. G5(2025) TaxID=3406628 RepID=UPI003C1B7584
MADDLYARYMKAAAANRAHGATCSWCSPGARCETGQHLAAEFARLQDAYLKQQKKKR